METRAYSRDFLSYVRLNENNGQMFSIQSAPDGVQNIINNTEDLERLKLFRINFDGTPVQYSDRVILFEEARIGNVDFEIRIDGKLYRTSAGGSGTSFSFYPEGENPSTWIRANTHITVSNADVLKNGFHITHNGDHYYYERPNPHESPRLHKINQGLVPHNYAPPEEVSKLANKFAANKISFRENYNCLN